MGERREQEAPVQFRRLLKQTNVPSARKTILIFFFFFFLKQENENFKLYNKAKN